MLWINVVNTAMGIVMIFYQTWQANSSVWNTVLTNFGLPYYSISISLNVLLTLMIVIRLIVHSRDVRSTLGTPGGISGLYKALITMLIESSALYTINSLLVIGLWAGGSTVAEVFFPVLAEVQVRAFLRLRSSDRLPNVMTG